MKKKWFERALLTFEHVLDYTISIDSASYWLLYRKVRARNDKFNETNIIVVDSSKNNSAYFLPFNNQSVRLDMI